MSQDSALPPIVILMADDSEVDLLLAKESFNEFSLLNDFRSVSDGQELMDYLRRQGRFQNPEDSPLPGLILLDLGMPHKNGHEALKEIKADPQFSRIPVIVLTVSQEEADQLRAYDLGAEGYMHKPVEFQKLVNLINDLSYFWIEVVSLSPEAREALSSSPLFRPEQRFSGETLTHQDRAFQNEIADDQKAGSDA
jgi:CheY-like chemotaxis protein